MKKADGQIFKTDGQIFKTQKQHNVKHNPYIK